MWEGMRVKGSSSCVGRGAAAAVEGAAGNASSMPHQSRRLSYDTTCELLLQLCFGQSLSDSGRRGVCRRLCGTGRKQDQQKSRRRCGAQSWRASARCTTLRRRRQRPPARSCCCSASAAPCTCWPPRRAPSCLQPGRHSTGAVHLLTACTKCSAQLRCMAPMAFLMQMRRSKQHGLLLALSACAEE